VETPVLLLRCDLTGAFPDPSHQPYDIEWNFDGAGYGRKTRLPPVTPRESAIADFFIGYGRKTRLPPVTHDLFSLQGGGPWAMGAKLGCRR
jgi:hypothetical protein